MLACCQNPLPRYFPLMTEKNDHQRALAVPASRLARFGRLSTLTAGIAGNMAVNGVAQLGKGQRPSVRNLLLTPRNITRVAEQLAQMRGAAMKIGQMMSMDTGDVLPPELAIIMARLRDDAHFMPPAQLKQVLNAEWPANWLWSFAHFDVRPIAAASIGQVHRARLKDGTDMAIKVQYPGVAKSIDSDVANVGALMRMSGLLPKGFDLQPYLEEGRKQLHEETDYRREGTQLTRFRALLANDPRFVVPKRFEEWSTQSILAMSHVSGCPIEEMHTAPQDLRNRIMTELIDLTLQELLEFGVMQTDPNFANYRFQTDSSRIVLLDFGATRDLDPIIVAQYRRLLRAGLAGDTAAIDKTARDIGFIGSQTKDRHSAQIVRMIGMVFDALKVAPLVEFTNTEMSQRMQTEGIALAEDGFVPPPLPIDVLLLQRKFGGMFLLGARLGAQVDVIALLERHLRDLE